MTAQQAFIPNKQVQLMADRLSIDPADLQNIVINTIMPTGSNAPKATNEQFISFLAVANEYKLNPMTKEIYAFPAKGGGIQPIVSIDGWLKIINEHPDFDGMKFQDALNDKGEIISVTCQMFRKNRSHPVEVTEYMSECAGTSEPWKRWPARMLRHKSAIQCARYAFGFSGISDPDEGERIQSVQKERELNVVPETGEVIWPQENFNKQFPHWKQAIQSGMKTPDEIIAMASSKGSLSKEQIKKIKNIQGAA